MELFKACIKNASNGLTFSVTTKPDQNLKTKRMKRKLQGEVYTP